MNDSRNHRRQLLIITLGLAVAFFIAAKPATAHALDFLNLGSIAYAAVLDLILQVLVTINTLLGTLLNAVGGLLNWVLSLEIVTQLLVIEEAWKIIRDMCNLVFIVVFIGIAFGTIFNAIGLFKGWHYSTALMPLIIAAIVMNFSLAIGKTITLASNEAAKKVLEIVGDPGGMLISSLKPNALVMGVDQNAKNALNSSIADAIRTRTEAEQIVFDKCLTEEKVLTDSNESNFNYTFRFYTGIGIGDTKVRKGEGDCYIELQANRFNTTPEAIVAPRETTVPSGDTTQTLIFIANSIFNALMILMLISCLGSAAIFLGLRIVVVWVLLAGSALAWASYAIPGDKAGFHKWWEHMIAWNVFGPLYLLTLIPGLILMGGSGEIILQLQRAGGDFGSQLIQQFFFYAFAVLIFVGGLALSLKSSFAGTVAATQGVGGLATSLGVFQTGEGKLGQISKYTGATAAFQGARAGVTKEFIEPFKERGVRRQADIQAQFQKTFGDRSAMDDLQRKRITEQFDKNKAAGRSVADLNEDFRGTVGTPKYFAAAKALLEADELDAGQMSAYVAAATKVSPSFGQAVKEATQRQVKSNLKDKKFKTVDEATQAMGLLNPKEHEAAMKQIMNAQPLLYAKMAAAGHVIDGDKKLSTSEALEKVATKLSDEEWIEAYKDEKITFGDKAQYNFNAKLTGRDKEKFLGSADVATREKLTAEAVKLGGQQSQGRNEQSTQSGSSESEKSQAAQSAANMAGGISDERREEIRRDMAALNQNKPNA